MRGDEQEKEEEMEGRRGIASMCGAEAPAGRGGVGWGVAFAAIPA